MNIAPGGTRAIVDLRTQLLGQLPDHPELAPVDADLHDLLGGWFNPGFLTFTRIDWNSPASLLEKFLRYEKVHRMRALEDLKRRLAADRRCFAFFHPALPDEPLIFVEVALVGGMADRIQPLIDPEAPVGDPAAADMRDLLLDQQLPGGPARGHARQFPDQAGRGRPRPRAARAQDLRHPLADPGLRRLAARGAGPAGARRRWPASTASSWPRWTRRTGPSDPETAERLRLPLSRLCAQYLAREKRGGRPRDPVARFHLGNGARLERINWLGDLSAKGLAESFGLLVNYKYDAAMIERNHEALHQQWRGDHVLGGQGAAAGCGLKLATEIWNMYRSRLGPNPIAGVRSALTIGCGLPIHRINRSTRSHAALPPRSCWRPPPSPCWAQPPARPRSSTSTTRATTAPTSSCGTASPRRPASRSTSSTAPTSS